MQFFRTSKAPLVRLLRWSTIVVAVALALLVLSWLAMPALVRHVAIDQIEKQLGRKAGVGDVRFNPLSLTLELDKFILYEPDGATPAVRFENLFIDAQLSSVPRLAPVIREIRLVSPSVHLVRNRADGAGRHNFSDIVERLAAKPKTESSPPRFSVANIQLTHGAVLFDDRVTGKKVTIAALEAGIPFVSNFDNAIDTFVLPKLAATVNGTPLALTGRSKPFSGNRETTLAIDIDGLDLAELAAFSPAELPVKIAGASLRTRLDLDFKLDGDAPRVSLAGDAALARIAIDEPGGAPLLKAEELAVRIGRLDLLNGDLAIDSMSLRSPQVWAALDSGGKLNWLALDGKKAPSTATATVSAVPPTAATANLPANTAASSASAPAAPVPPAGVAVKPPRQFSLARLDIRNGVLNWRDAANATPALSQQLNNIVILGGNLSLAPGANPAYLRLDAGAAGSQRLGFAGQIDVATGRVAGRVSLDALPLATYQPYLNASLAAALSGRLSLSSLVLVDKAQVRVSRAAVTIDDFRLAANSGRDGALAAKKIMLDGASVDTAARRFHAGSLTFSGLNGDVIRDGGGELNLSRFLAKAGATPAVPAKAPAKAPLPAPAPESATAPEPATAAATPSTAPVSAEPKSAGAQTGTPGDRPVASPTWLSTVDRFVLLDAALNLSDNTVSPPVKLRIGAIDLAVENISSDLDRPMKLVLRSTVGERGKLDVGGVIAARLASATLDIDAQALPLSLAQPYFAGGLNVTLAGGTASARGKLAVTLAAGDKPLTLTYAGTGRIADFRAVNKGSDADFMKWKSLDIDGIETRIGAGRPSITLGTVGLADFYMRAVLSEEGKLNLRQIVAAETAPATQTTPTPAGASVPAPVSASGAGKTPVRTGDTTTVEAAPRAGAATGPIVKVGKVEIKAGNINFTDNFVKPNYTVNMTGMNGSIGAFASENPAPAAIDIAGKIDNAAPVTISGSLNPLFEPMFLDIKASANGIELPRLTPYASKYAGYPIEKGKLSMDVTYRIDQQKLTAQNRVRIDQLTFGERVDSPSATNLPVLLAVALLKDRNGQIDIRLPISGSLDDPQFSIGGLIGRVLLNVLAKAVTSPFALVGSAFGSGSAAEELGYAEFAPGTSQLTPEVRTKLDTLAKALTDRPALKLDLIGRADQAFDTEGAKLQRLNRTMRMMKNKDSLDRGRNTQLEDVTLSDAERAGYLEILYKAATFEKPKNIVGLNKSLSADEMQALLLANADVTEDDLRSLANRRATVVRRYLENTGKIDLERMFLIAPRLGDSKPEKADKGPPSRVEFSLK